MFGHSFLLTRIGDDGVEWIPWAELLEFSGGNSNGLFLSWPLGGLDQSHHSFGFGWPFGP